jgi:pimeloyl-ACP methyl ester carboxylesterase
MHAVVGGKGPPLVLLHGFPQTWWEWHKMMPRLAKTHTVVALDPRGAGHSDCPRGGTSLARPRRMSFTIILAMSDVRLDCGKLTQMASSRPANGADVPVERCRVTH